MALASITFQFGLVSFPAKLDKATETPVEMKNLCVGQPQQPPHDPTPLTAPRVCASCGPIVDNTVIVKGIKQGTTYAITTQESVAEAKIKNTDAYKGKVNLVPHPSSDFEAHTAPGKSLYFLTPDPAAADHYALMVRLVSSHPELSFVSLYTPRSAAGLYRVVVRDGVLVLEERTRGQAIKAAPQISGTVNDALYGMLEGVLSTLVQPYDPATYEDQYAVAINRLAVAAQDMVSLGKGPSAEAPAAVSTDDDLMAKLAALAAQAAA
jgi:non-homologous end joining protein Ku